MSLAGWKHDWGPRLCSWVPLSLWRRLAGMDLVVPHWHLVGDRDVPHVGELYGFRTARQFGEDLEFFLRHFKPVTLQDVIRHAEGTARLAGPCFLPTFDDGFREIHEVVAPMLRRRGVPAAFFLTTSVLDNRDLAVPQRKSLLLRALRDRRGSAAEREAVRILHDAGLGGGDVAAAIRGVYHRWREVLDRLAPVLGCDFDAYAATVRPYLSSDQVRELIGMGFGIGAHGVDHPLFSELTLDQQVQQACDSLGWLSERFGFTCEAFAFPYTDAGVAAGFHERARARCTLKVSFGTGAVGGHFSEPGHLKRFTMERTDRPAAEILGRELGLQCWRTMAPWPARWRRNSVGGGRR